MNPSHSAFTRFHLLFAVLALTGFATRGGAQCQTLEHALNNPSPAASDFFGAHVAISGNYVLVGAQRDDTGATDSGSAYLFDATTGAFLRAFNNPFPADGDQFGSSVAISGNYVLVGAGRDDGGAIDTGSAYLFDAPTGALLRTFSNPFPGSSDFMGSAVAISGNVVLLGSPGASGVGAVYLFDVATGLLLRSINNPFPNVGDAFGGALAISEAYVLVGAYQDDTGANDTGSAYLFDASTGALLRTFSNPSPAASDLFGTSLAISGSNLLVAAEQDDAGATDAGSVYLFDAATGNLIRAINNPFPGAGDLFGAGLALSGTHILVGAYQDDSVGVDAGTAYLFDVATGSLLLTFSDPNAAASDYFGRSLAIDGYNIVVGAYGDDTGASEAGRAYMYGCLSPTPTPTPNYFAMVSPNDEAGGRFGVSVVGMGDATGDAIPDLLIGANLEDPGASPSDSGKAYLYSGANLQLDISLSSPSPATSGQFGRNVRGIGDITGDGLVDLIVSAPGETAGGFTGAGKVHLFDGATGALIRSHSSPNPEAGGQFGARGNGINDVTGDGKTDVLVSSTFEDPGASPTDAGRVYVFNSQTGALFRTYVSPAEEANGNFGLNAIGLKDVTGDGKGDLLVGAPGEDPGSAPDGSGVVYLMNGATGAVVWSAASPSPQLAGRFGAVVSRLDDVTGDGKMDVAVGAPDESANGINAGSGRVHTFNGATGAFLRTIPAPNPQTGGGFGQSIANIPDTNGDGWGDLVIGAPYVNNPGIAAAGRVYVVSGRNGAVLRVIDSPEPEASAEFGFSVGAVPDLDGNGYAEYVIGARKADPGAAPSDAGRVYLFYGKLLP